MVNYMSTIIGLCGTNYCLLASDTRKVKPDENGNWVVDNDTTEKVFKLNGNVLFGATGKFWALENIDEPLRNYQDMSKLSLPKAVALVEKYIVDNIGKIISYHRQYIVAGREFDGAFCIVAIRLNEQEHRIDRVVYRAPIQNSHASVIALPDSLSDNASAEKFKKFLSDGMVTCETLDDVYRHVADTIFKIADADTQHTVGGDARFVVLI